jgi:hypothetical protein
MIKSLSIVYNLPRRKKRLTLEQERTAMPSSLGSIGRSWQRSVRPKWPESCFSDTSIPIAKSTTDLIEELHKPNRMGVRAFTVVHAGQIGDVVTVISWVDILCTLSHKLVLKKWITRVRNAPFHPSKQGSEYDDLIRSHNQCLGIQTLDVRTEKV